jgi:hypothetical protein
VIIIVAVGISLALLIALVAVGLVCNPLLIAFLDEFTVCNDSGEDITVVPIGMWERTGEYGPLPLYRRRFPALPVRGTSGTFVPAGGTARFIYDWDDINFRHILVRSASGKTLIVDTDRRGSVNWCYAAERDIYRIPVLRGLPPADRELLPCFTGASVPYSKAKQYP